MMEEKQTYSFKSKTMLWVVLFVVATVAGIYVRFANMNDLRYTIWCDRDFVRAQELESDFQVSGAELTGRGETRIPGGFYYYLLRALMTFFPNPVHLFVIEILLDILAMLVLFYFVREYFCPLSGLAAVSLYALSVTAAWNHTRFAMANPGFTPIFQMIAYFLLLRILVCKEANKIPWFVFVIGLVAQIHLSFWVLLFFLIVGLVVYRIRVPLRYGLWSLAALALAFSPFIISELLTGFAETSKLYYWVAVHAEKYKYLADKYLQFDRFMEILFGVTPFKSAEGLSLLSVGMIVYLASHLFFILVSIYTVAFFSNFFE